MTLPASGSISIGQVAAELGIGLPLSLGDARVLTLAGKGGPPISLTDLYGKSAVPALAATGVGDSNFADTSLGAGTVICHPSVTVTGGVDPKTFAWSFLSNTGGSTLSAATSQVCTVSHSYVHNAAGSATALLRCVVTDAAGTSITVNNIAGNLDWSPGS